MIGYINQAKTILKSKTGDIVQMIIVLIVVAVVATVALPPMMNSISDKGATSIDKLDSLDTALDVEE